MTHSTSPVLLSVSLIDANYRVLETNPESEALLGAPVSHFIGRCVWDLFPELLGTEVEIAHRRAMNERISLSVENWYAPWGRSFDISLLPHTSGGLTVFIRETTTAHLAELAAEQARARLVELLDVAYLGIWYCDLPGGNVVANASFRKHFGIPADHSVVLDDLFAYMHEADRARAGACCQRAKLEGSTCDVEFRDLSGQRWIRSIGRFYLNAAGEPARFDGLSLDISDQKATERALEETSEDLRQFAYSASHDLQEPLRVLKGYLALLDKRLQPSMDADTREFLGFAAGGAQRLESLLAGMRDYWRASNVERASAPVDCEQVLGAALHMLAPAIQAEDAEITHDPLPLVDAHEIAMLQLFQNLIGNAIKYRSEARPRIHVGAHRQPEGWLFLVRDNGLGIPEGGRSQVFRVFKRLHEGNRSGAGLGLAICSRIVERFGGRIWVDSEPGRGSTFYFTLPSAAR